MQLEDDLYRTMDQRGWDRHDPQAMKNLIESFQGYRDIFRVDGKPQRQDAALLLRVANLPKSNFGCMRSPINIKI